jgi:hypothetical protein
VGTDTSTLPAKGGTYLRCLAPVKFRPAIRVRPKVYSEKEGPGGTMRILPAVLIIQSVIEVASAALKPIETDIRPVDNKAAAVYKTTPQGDLKINLYFPPPLSKTGSCSLK